MTRHHWDRLRRWIRHEQQELEADMVALQSAPDSADGRRQAYALRVRMETLCDTQDRMSLVVRSQRTRAEGVRMGGKRCVNSN
jgi:putative heme degradation protein